MAQFGDNDSKEKFKYQRSLPSYRQTGNDSFPSMFGDGKGGLPLKDVPFAFGQAQARIKNTYNQHAQAQGHIKHTYPECIGGGEESGGALLGDFILGDTELGSEPEEGGGTCIGPFGQAQASITSSVTTYKHGQSQAWIEQTYYVHGQANAWIENSYFGHGQAQAWIEATNNGHGQAQGDIKQTYNVHGQAQALIGAIGRGFGQAQGQIKQTYYVHGQSQADIKQVYYVHGQGQALIDSTRVYGQAQAEIEAQDTIIAGYGQAQAWIARRFIWDTFSRTTDPGDPLGTPDTGDDWFADTTFTSLDGTVEIVEGSSDFDYLIAENHTAEGSYNTFMAVVEFTRLGEIGDYAYLDHVIQTNSGGFGIIQYNNIPDPEIELFISYDEDERPSINYEIFPDIPYVLKIWSIGPEVRGKIWIKGNPEPDWMLYAILPSLEGFWDDQNFYYITYVDIGEGGTLPRAVEIDNLEVFELGVYTAATMAHGQAGAYIIGETYVHGQAQAEIISATKQRFGQAQGWIETTYYKHGQAQAEILSGTKLRYGQAQAFITTTKPSGQAQGAIVTKIGRSAQAQAYILNHWRWFGQAQAEIKTSYMAHGQAQALIRRTEVYGQAQAMIRRSQGYGQAVAMITGNAGYLIRDTFSRTTDLGVVGTPDVGVYANESYELPGDYLIEFTRSYVDGSVLRTTFDDTEDYEFVTQKAIFYAEDMEVYIDFRFDILNDWMTLFDVMGRVALSSGDALRFNGYYDPVEENTFITLQASGGTITTDIPTLLTNTWYTVRLSIQGIDVKGKIWERDDPEPGTWLLETTTNYLDGGGAGYYADSGEVTLGGDIVHEYDNFFVIGNPTAYAAPVNSGQAQAYIELLRRGHGQAQALIIRNRPTGQAQAYITGTNYQHGQAQATINVPIKSGQAQALITRGGTPQYGQAQAVIAYHYQVTGLAQAMIRKSVGHGQAQARILGFGNLRSGNAQAFIRRTDTRFASGQAMAQIKRNDFTGQAQALIAGGRYLVKYNGYQMPGYAQLEDFASTERIVEHDPIYQLGHFSEYIGLENKTISLQMKVLGETYVDVKNQVQTAGTIARSSKGWTKLYIQRYDRYYTAMAQYIRTSKTVGQSMRVLDYTLDFEAKPWLTSDTMVAISGVGTVDTGLRNYDNGGWTPAKVIVSGTNVTISGYTETGEFTGFITISGVVAGMVIDSDEYTAEIVGQNANSQMYRPDYRLYVGPGKTYFEIDGATDCVIEYHDRWYL